MWEQLKRSFDYKIEESTAKYIINTTYVIVLGVIFSSILHLSLKQDSSGNEYFHIKLALSSETIFFSILLVFYFLFDWFSTNVFVEAISRVAETPQGHQPGGRNMNSRKMINHFFLLILVVVIIILGFTVIYSINKNITKYLLFGLYGIFIPFGDWKLAMKKILPLLKEGHELFYRLVFVYFRSMLAFSVAIITFFHLVRPGKLSGDFYTTIIILTIFILLMKLFRYGYLISLLSTERR